MCGFIMILYDFHLDLSVPDPDKTEPSGMIQGGKQKIYKNDMYIYRYYLNVCIYIMSVCILYIIYIQYM
jgi:hypothetical protein